jgi:type VI secretion system protein ImpH
MAAKSRRADSSLEQTLFERGYGFDFFQAVHLLAKLNPARRPVGQSASPMQEIVRFHAHASMLFPASAIQNIERLNGKPPAMTVNFLGITGPQGVLPAHYTELVIANERANDRALASFLDIFNHRLVSLFYRAWEKHHFVIGYERERAGRAGADHFTQYLLALIGMGAPGLQNRLSVPDRFLLRYAGLIAQRPHSASALRGFLSDYFDAPIEVDQFEGKWQTIDNDSLSFLDEPALHNQLGVGAIAGDAVWERQSKFRIRIGPVGIQRFTCFLPDQEAFRKMTELVRYFAGDALEFEVQLVLRAAEVSMCRLTDETPDAPRLGWLGWLKTEAFEEDAADAVF